jgi:NAD(P)-dependent dehydrogenase (short-subunit alcohol dehydrogenase family)
MSNTSKIVLITGATAGIGRMTALHLAKRGHHVIATGRKPAELQKLALEANQALAALGAEAMAKGKNGRKAVGKLDTLLLDVTSLASITAAAESVDKLTAGKGIDVLVNNAGFGALGPTSEITDAEMRRNYETNVFGLMNVTRAFLPRMMQRHNGRIVNVSSVGGRITLPYFGVYNSTKYALESLSDALRYELRPFGVDVTMIEPGVIRTNFEATAVANLDAFAKTPFAKSVAKYEQMSKTADRFASNPIVIAKAIAKAVEARRPAARYVAPFSTNFVVLFARLFPTRVWDWAMRSVAFLNAKHLDVNSTSAKPAETTPSAPFTSAKPATDARAAAN